METGSIFLAGGTLPSVMATSVGFSSSCASSGSCLDFEEKKPRDLGFGAGFVGSFSFSREGEWDELAAMVGEESEGRALGREMAGNI